MKTSRVNTSHPETTRSLCQLVMTGWVEVFYLGQWDKGQADPQGIGGGAGIDLQHTVSRACLAWLVLNPGLSGHPKKCQDSN